MSAYNKVNGIHVCEDERFLREILREEWGWNGLVMSDWFGTYSTSEAINAGMDLEMPGPSRWRGEQAFVAASSDKSRPTALDDCARRVLNLVNECVRSGIPENAPELARDTPETTEFLRRLAAESIVLLKNDGGILPLKSHKKTLVVGPNARLARYCGGGSSELIPYHAVSPLEGIQEKIGAENVTFTIGAHSHKDLPDIARLLIPTLDSTENGVTFTPFNDAPGVKDRKPVEELLVRTSSMILLDYNNPKLAQLWYADIEGYLAADRTGEFQFGLCVFGAARLYVNGTLLIDATEVQKPGNAFFGCGTEEVKATLPLQKGDTYHVKVEFFSEPFSKLTPQAVTFPNGAVKVGGAWVINHQEEIRCAAALAREHEQVVLCIGLNNGWESEGFDRDDMKLPPYLDDLAAAVLEANPNTAVVVQSGAPVEMPWLSSTSALLQAWYGGNEAGHGIADVLYGDVNPSGKLSLSFPKKIEDNPAYFNFRCEAGRVLYGEDVYVGYRWYEGLKRPVNFPFGFGLSYTTFKFEDLSLKMDNESLTISVRVSNTGNVDGAQVLQIYVSHKNPSIRRPVKELKEFSKVFLTKGTNKTISLDIPLKYACSYFDERRDQWIFEKGQYTVIVSDSSRLETGKYVEADFKIDKTIWWSGM
ncbi:putative glycosyl hydrolase family 3 n terminal domain-containing protein [Phaeomoniella chlamydospora]|uniref:beta-glucosidase n=1 Tax=Phaeomoniella chlamydospora TaxID=158046 RepID=A0A0G2HEV5_PHACM|nr:putative glycosyl hydrolase family 3 n terminal domain-containing protein [Phaeomoniella chlamydospora]